MTVISRTHRRHKDGAKIMKQTYLVTTAAAALLAGTMFVFAQGTQKAGPGEGGAQGREQGQTQRDQDRKEQGRQGTTGQGKQQGQSKEAPTREGQSKEQPRTEGQRQGGNVNLTVEQRTRVRETVLTKGPRATNVNFNISVGTVVPTSVRIVEIDPILVEYFPRYRGFFYFILNDEIIIVDRNHKIVAVIDV